MKEPLNIRIVEGNAFTLVCVLCSRIFANRKPEDTPIDGTELEQIKVKINGQPYDNFTTATEGVLLHFPEGLPRNVYNIEIEAMYHGSPIRTAYYRVVSIVEFNEHSNAEAYMQGSPLVIELPTAYILGGSILDAVLQAIEEAVEQLQGTNTAATLTAVLQVLEGIHIPDDYAKSSEVTAAALQIGRAIETLTNNTAQDYERLLAALALVRVGLQGGEAGATLSVIKRQIEEIVIPDIPTDYATSEQLEQAVRDIVRALPDDYATANGLTAAAQAIINALPKMRKVTVSEYAAMEEYDDTITYLLTDNAGTKIIARYVGATPMPLTSGTIFGESAFGNAILL